MFMESFVKLKGCWRTLLVVSALLACFELGLSARAQSASVWPPQSPQTPNHSTIPDPTRPEVQQPLDVDRDPIPSPDDGLKPPPSVVAPSVSTAPAAPSPNAPNTSSSAPNVPGRPGEIQKQENGMYILHTDVDEVLLNCAVLDQKGRPVLDLSRENFRVWEDGVPQTVNAAQHLDVPVSMGILIDNSGSMRDKRSAVNAATRQLLTASNPLDEAFVVNFADHAYLDQRFTTDRIALDRGITRSDSSGTTAMYDAVAASADELAKDGKNRKQVLLIITDGADNASRVSLQESIRRVQGLGGPVVYAIGLLFDAPREEAAESGRVLETLAQETGGIAYFPGSLQDLDSIAAQVASDIREQYVVDYHASKPLSLGGYRTVRVEAVSSSHGPLSVRTKRGYYAQPQNPDKLKQQSQQ
jgi:Ca-activated chloride channel homolog